MAAKKPQSTSLSKLIGKSIVVKDGENDADGIIVPMGPEENRMANMLLAAQMRQVIREMMKRYKERDALLTPKELKDLADSAKILTEFSGNVYSGGQFEVQPKSGPEEASPEAFKADFSGMKVVTPETPENPVKETQ